MAEHTHEIARPLPRRDVAFFRADRPHAYRNPAAIETVLHLTMTYAGDWSVAVVDFG